MALEPRVYSDCEFYEQLIKLEEEQKPTGYKERVKALKDIL